MDSTKIMEGRELKLCEVSIPKSGKKILYIAGKKIFARPMKGCVYFYDVDTKILLCAVDEKKFDYAVQLLTRKIKEIPDEVTS